MIVTVAAVISSVPALILGIIFPLVFVAALLSLDQKLVLEINVSSNPEVIHTGEETTIDAVLKIPRGFGLILLRFPIDPKFDLAHETTNVHVLFKGLKPLQRTYTYKIKALRRGIFEFKEIIWSYYPALGLLNKTDGKLALNMTIKVLPKIQVLQRTQMRVKSRHLIPRQSRARLGPFSTDFVSVRDYSVGDPYKFVNWKASSRSPNQNTLLVNDYEREGLRTFIFLLDRGELMTHGTVEENPLEYGIAFILSYSRFLLEHGANVGLWLVPTPYIRFENEEGRRKKMERPYILPSSGTEHYQRLKEMLMHAEPIFQPDTRPEGRAPHINPEYEEDAALVRIVKEARPTVILITNVTASNVAQLARFAMKLLKLHASLTILDVMPYSIIAKYGLVNRGVSLKSLLLPLKKKNQYTLLPRGVQLIPWDPETEGTGKAVRTSIALTGQFS